MLAWLEQFLVRYPELALFLVIAAGYWIGSFKIGTFSLGPVTGALFAGLAVGDFAHVPVSSMTKSFLFLLFLFGVGYLGRPAIRANDEARRAEADAARGRRVLDGPRNSDCRCQDVAARSRLRRGAHVGRAQPERGDGDGDRRDQRIGHPRRAACTFRLARRGGGCGLLHLRLCRRHPVRHSDRTRPPENRSASGGAQARAGIGSHALQAGPGIGLAEIRAARLSAGGALAARRGDGRSGGSPHAGSSAVHPSNPSRRTPSRSGARNRSGGRRPHRAIRSAPGHRRMDRPSRRGGRGQGAARHSPDLRRCHADQSEARGHDAGAGLARELGARPSICVR